MMQLPHWARQLIALHIVYPILEWLEDPMPPLDASKATSLQAYWPLCDCGQGSDVNTEDGPVCLDCLEDFYDVVYTGIQRDEIEAVRDDPASLSYGSWHGMPGNASLIFEYADVEGEGDGDD